MKKIFTLIVAFMAVISANAQTVETYSPTDEKGAAKAEWVSKDTVTGNVVDIDATPSVHLYALSGPESGWTEGATLPLEGIYKNAWAVKNNRNNVWDETLKATKTLYVVNGAGNPTVGVAWAAKYTDGEPTGTYRVCYDQSIDPKGPWYAEDGKTELKDSFNFYYQPSGVNGLPVRGIYYKITPSKNGTMKFLVWNNKGNRPVYVADGETAVALDPVKGEVKYSGYVNGKDEYIDSTQTELGKKMIFYENLAPVEGKEYVPQAVINSNMAAWVYLTFDVKADKSYWLFNGNTQLGFGGFEFTAEAGGGDVPEGAVDLKWSTRDTLNCTNACWKFLDTEITLEPAGGRDFNKYGTRQGWLEGLNFKNNTNQVLNLGKTKMYAIQFYGYSQGDNWDYLYAYGYGEATGGYEWVDPIGSENKNNSVIINQAKYPLDPCEVSEAYRDTVPTYHQAGYNFATINFGDEPYEGQFQFKFSGNNQETCSIRIWTVPFKDDKLLGDANDDKTVDVADITTIAAYILNPKSVTINTTNADANEDKTIDVADITATAQIILSK